MRYIAGMARIIQKDIARETGYSEATISRALADSALIGQRAKQKIRRAADRMGYLQTNRNVAVITPFHFYSGYFGMVATALCRELAGRGFHPLVIDISDRDILEELPLCGAFSTVAVSGFEQWWGKEHSWPLVCVNAKPMHLDNIFMTGSDDAQGMTLLVEHLIRSGHRRIFRLSHTISPTEINWGEQGRTRVFEELAGRHGVESRSGFCEENNASILRELHRALDFSATAILIQTENYCRRILSLLSMLGIRVPEDISIVTWEFPEEAETITPAPTYVSQDLNGIAVRACQQFTRLLAGDVLRQDELIEYTFHPGETVRNLTK